MINNISVIGTGYVGLVSGACLSEFGQNVVCMDIDKDKIDKLKKGIIPIYEPGLEDIVKKNYSEGRLKFTTDFSEAVGSSDVIFIAVGTPPREDGSADLQYVLSVAEQIAQNMNDYKVIVNKSTVPVGTAKLVKKTVKDILKKRGLDIDFDVVSNPEFLREGSAVKNFIHPDRIIIGSESKKALDIMKSVYRVLYLNNSPFLFTLPETSELIKYASNAFLAVKISFINEISNLCEVIGADVTEVAKGMGLDGRIGKYFLHAGPGYGGSCFPKDTKALLKIAADANTEVSIVKAAVDANEKQKNRMTDKIKKAFGGNIQGKKIAVLGIAFKPETDDVRESPAVAVINGLVAEGALVAAFDPAAMKNAEKYALNGKGIGYSSNEYKACEDADAVVIVTEWNRFRNLDLKRIKESMKGNIFVDLRNIYSKEITKPFGFKYYSVGRI
jgi:UDPglucose 6-dehydrogenase